MTSLGIMIRLVIVIVSLVGPSAVYAQAPVTHTRVEGIAYDSLAKRPLALAMVSVVGVGKRVTADEKGRFRIDSVPVGAQTFLPQHPAFDSIGLSGASQRVVVQPKGDRVVLALPSFERLWRGTCGDAPVSRDSGLVYGVVRDADTQEGLPNVAIDLSWIDLVGGGKQLTDVGQRRWRRASQTDAIGEFAICGVPLATPLSLRASRDSVDKSAIEMPASPARVRRRDLVIARVVTSNVKTALSDSIGPEGKRVLTDAAVTSTASGVVVGTVVNEAGLPIANAAVSVDAGEEVLSGADGRFFVRQLPSGAKPISIRAIGRLPYDSLLNLREGDTTSLLVSMSPVSVLEAVKVSATTVSTRVRGFEDRKRSGFGAFRDSSEIKNYPAFTSLMRTIPNVTLKQPAMKYLIFNLGSGTQCSASYEQVDFRLDGMPITPEAIDVLDLRHLAAVEVYSRATKLPTELATSIKYRCAVLLWTKQGFGK